MPVDRLEVALFFAIILFCLLVVLRSFHVI